MGRHSASLIFLNCVFFFKDKVSLCSVACHESNSVDQAGLNSEIQINSVFCVIVLKKVGELAFKKNILLTDGPRMKVFVHVKHMLF